MGDEERWLTEQEDRAWRGYRRMALVVGARVSRDLTRDSGLSEPDYDVLSALSESDDHRQRIRELADRMLWSTSRLSHHITRMQQRGLVAREECPEDGRAAVVVLTPQGLRAIREAAPLHVESVRKHFIGLLTPQQLHVLAQIAGAVVTQHPVTARPLTE